MKSYDKFPDPDVYAAQREIKQRYNAVLSKLIKTIQSAEVKNMLSNFRDVLDEPKDDPFGKLPVYNVAYGLSPEFSKYRCLLNFISRMVQRNWVFNEGEDLETTVLIKSDLTFLESIAEKGLDAFEIKGNKFPGYYLSKKERG